MSPIDAYHLPGIGAGDVAEWDVREYGDGIALRVPVLAPRTLARLLARLRRARAEHLAGRPVDEVVRAVDTAAARLVDPEDPARHTLDRALPAVTGYSEPMARLVVDRMAADWRAAPLRRALAAELGDPGVLDGFRPDPTGGEPRRVRAFGPALAFHVFAGNVPGVAVTSLVRSLLVKAATIGKTASGDPLFPAVFARALAEVDPTLGECLAVSYWPGGTEPLEAVALDAADAIIVYGRGEVVDDLRRRAPADARLVAHGPRFSFGLVGRAALADEPAVEAVAGRVARATSVFDQRGCVSPHVAYVERGGAVGPEAFAERLAAAFDALERELPRGALDAAEAAAIHELRGRAEFRAMAAGAEEGGGPRLYIGRGTEYTVLYDDDPAFEPSCLNRVLWVKPIDALEDAVRYVEPFAAYLQTVGIEGVEDPRRAALAERIGRVGASRVTSFDRMPWPPAAWHHDGRGPLRELLRWTDLEPDGDEG
ncbi:MAG: acyl-CoA reductase [Gemmatimonadota bacterium]